MKFPKKRLVTPTRKPTRSKGSVVQILVQIVVSLKEVMPNTLGELALMQRRERTTCRKTFRDGTAVPPVRLYWMRVKRRHQDKHIVSVRSKQRYDDLFFTAPPPPCQGSLKFIGLIWSSAIRGETIVSVRVQLILRG